MIMYTIHKVGINIFKSATQSENHHIDKNVKINQALKYASQTIKMIGTFYLDH